MRIYRRLSQSHSPDIPALTELSILVIKVFYARKNMSIPFSTNDTTISLTRARQVVKHCPLLSIRHLYCGEEYRVEINVCEMYGVSWGRFLGQRTSVEYLLSLPLISRNPNCQLVRT